VTHIKGIGSIKDPDTVRRTNHMDPVRILVADDHEIVRRGLVFLLKSHAGWDVCGEAQDGREGLQRLSL
jgi:CheY-like chemotaxis protein